MYRLKWQESVTNDLLEATALADPSLRDRILEAINEVESTLENDADAVGESREANVRFLIVAPLSVTYKIDARQREVLIVRASIHQRKS
jgi:hypothetical protein